MDYPGPGPGLDLVWSDMGDCCITHITLPAQPLANPTTELTGKFRLYQIIRAQVVNIKLNDPGQLHMESYVKFSVKKYKDE